MHKYKPAAAVEARRPVKVAAAPEVAVPFPSFHEVLNDPEEDQGVLNADREVLSGDLEDLNADREVLNEDPEDLNAREGPNDREVHPEVHSVDDLVDHSEVHLEVLDDLVDHLEAQVDL